MEDPTNTSAPAASAVVAPATTVQPKVAAAGRADNLQPRLANAAAAAIIDPEVHDDVCIRIARWLGVDRDPRGRPAAVRSPDSGHGARARLWHHGVQARS